MSLELQIWGSMRSICQITGKSVDPKEFSTVRVLTVNRGRALDTAPPALYTLLEIQKHCPEVLTKCEVYIDGGVRRGTDVVKALCLGAKGVGLGRPMLYALTYGEEGVVHAIESESIAPDVSTREVLQR
jgi:isopentenyl diphosphate isomerase/L-lactate dehydrogenase-like FMN-dependent dehydrogenase